MKRFSFLSIFLGLLFVSLLQAAVADTTTTEPTILVFGDSLSAGYGLQKGEEWPALLQKKLQAEQKNYTIINASISGETTLEGLARFRTTFDKYKPEILILELGANDGLRGKSLKKMSGNLKSMIHYSQQHEAKVLLVGMELPANYGKRYVTAFRDSFPQVAEETNIPLTPFLLSGLKGKPELFQDDGLHPKAEAQPMLLNTVWQSLQPLL